MTSSQSDFFIGLRNPALPILQNLDWLYSRVAIHRIPRIVFLSDTYPDENFELDKANSFVLDFNEAIHSNEIIFNYRYQRIEVNFSFQLYSPVIIEKLIFRLVDEGVFIVIDTAKTREELSFLLDKEEITQRFSISIQKISNVSKLYQGILISESAIASRFDNYCSIKPLEERDCIVLRKEKKKDNYSSDYYHLFSNLCHNDDQLIGDDEEEEMEVLSPKDMIVKNQRQKSSAKKRKLEKRREGTERRVLQATEEKEPPIIDLTLPDEPLKMLLSLKKEIQPLFTGQIEFLIRDIDKNEVLLLRLGQVGLKLFHF